MIPTQNIEYEDTGCRYYPSCLNCGEPDECIFEKRKHKQTLEQLKLNKKKRDALYYAKNREYLIEQKRLKRLEKAKEINEKTKNETGV